MTQLKRPPTHRVLVGLFAIALIAIGVWFLIQYFGGQVSQYNGTVPASQTGLSSGDVPAP